MTNDLYHDRFIELQILFIIMNKIMNFLIFKFLIYENHLYFSRVSVIKV